MENAEKIWDKSGTNIFILQVFSLFDGHILGLLRLLGPWPRWQGKAIRPEQQGIGKVTIADQDLFTCEKKIRQFREVHPIAEGWFPPPSAV